MIQDNQTSLTKNQKEAIGLLSIGTFLEYFDLMLYVHMAVILNDLFFPKFDPFATSLLSAFSFCSVFLLRPVGAIVFGQLGDRIGRKSIVMITTFLMSFSCIVMATLPTYQQIGIASAWFVTICRMVQGMTSMGEIIGAEIYLTEFIKRPIQFPAVMLIAISSVLGGTVALGTAFITTKYEFNWRVAFWLGAGIALVGGVARTALKETTDFADAKLRLKNTLAKSGVSSSKLRSDPIVQEKVNKHTIIAFFFIQCGWSISFYFAYVYCGNLLKSHYGYLAEEVIQQNFIMSMVGLSCYLIILYLSFKFHPLKILKTKVMIFIPFALLCPYIFAVASSPLHIFFIQAFLVSCFLSLNPAPPIFFSYFPIFKRFTCVGLTYAIARLLMHIITSFGTIYSQKYFGNFGLWLIILPTTLGYGYGVFYFLRLEKEAGKYHDPDYRTSAQHSVSA